jgi:hypothetical protein
MRHQVMRGADCDMAYFRGGPGVVEGEGLLGHLEAARGGVCWALGGWELDQPEPTIARHQQELERLVHGCIWGHRRPFITQLEPTKPTRLEPNCWYLTSEPAYEDLRIVGHVNALAGAGYRLEGSQQLRITCMRHLPDIRCKRLPWVALVSHLESQGMCTYHERAHWIAEGCADGRQTPE